MGTFRRNAMVCLGKKVVYLDPGLFSRGGNVSRKKGCHLLEGTGFVGLLLRVVCVFTVGEMFFYCTCIDFCCYTLKSACTKTRKVETKPLNDQNNAIKYCNLL